MDERRVQKTQEEEERKFQCERIDMWWCEEKDETGNKKKEFLCKERDERRKTRDTRVYALGAPGTDWKQGTHRG